MYNYGVSSNIPVPKIMLPSSRSRKASDGIEGVTNASTDNNNGGSGGGKGKSGKNKSVPSGATQAIDIGEEDWCENTHKKGKLLVCFAFWYISVEIPGTVVEYHLYRNILFSTGFLF